MGGIRARRIVEADIHAAVEAALDAPGAPFTVVALRAPPLCGGTRLLRETLLPRLRARTPVGTADHDAGWPRDELVVSCVEASRVPATAPRDESQARVLLTVCRRTDDLPGWVTDGSVALREFALGPLSLVEAQDLLESKLGGAMDPAAVRLLASLAGFLPDLLERLIEECQLCGGIEMIDGAWRLLGDPVHTAIAPYVRLRLHDLPEPRAAALSELAVTEPFPPDAVSSAAAHLASELLTAGLLARRDDGAIEFAAPGIAEAIRVLSPEATQARAYAASLRAGRLSLPGLRWATRSGTCVPLQDAVAFAAACVEQHDWQTAVAVAELAQDRPELFTGGRADDTGPASASARRGHLFAELHLLAAWASRFLPDAERAHSHLDLAQDRVPEQPTDDTAKLLTDIRVIRAELLHYHQGDLDGALAHLGDGVRGAGRGTLIAHTILHLTWGGRSHESRTMLEHERRAIRHCPPRLRTQVAIAETLTLVAVGRPQQALRRVTALSLRRMLSMRRAAWVNEEQQVAYVIAALSSDGPAAFAGLRKHLTGSRDDVHRPDLVTFYAARATWEFAGGDVAEADRLGSIALGAVDLLDPSGVEPTLAAIGAETAALRGDLARARALRDRFRTVPPRSSAAILGGAEAHVAAVGYLLDEDAASDSTLRIAATFTDTGRFGFAAEILYAGVRFRDRAAARTLRDIGGELDGALHAMRVAHASALLDGDPAALLDAADRFATGGMTLYAAEAAAAALDREGIPAGVRRRAAARVNAASAMQPLDGHAQLRAADREGEVRIPLTPREREIEALIGAGHSNQEIADRLRLSTRTIEGHISRLYRKIGERRRSPGRRGV